MMNVQIVGTGHYLPERVICNEQLAPMVGVDAAWIERATGVCQRRRVNGESTAEMAAHAVHRALSAADIKPNDIDVLISASAGKQQTIPCTAAFIHRQLGLTPRTFAFDVDVTCLGFLAGVTVGSSLIAQGDYRNVVVVSSELASGTIDYSQPESAVLFGDAAAAAVLQPTSSDSRSRFLLSRFRTLSEGAQLAQIRGGGTACHPNQPTTTPEMNLFQMEGPKIFKLAARKMGEFIDDFLLELGWQRQEIDGVIPHQASRMALKQLTARYGFQPSQVFQNLAERGNCVAASLPLALAEAVEQQRIQRGDKILLLGTGAGVTLGAAALLY